LADGPRVDWLLFSEILREMVSNLVYTSENADCKLRIANLKTSMKDAN